MKARNKRRSLKKLCRFKLLLIQFFPVALLVIFLLVYAKCNFASVLKVVLESVSYFFLYNDLLSICYCFFDFGFCYVDWVI